MLHLQTDYFAGTQTEILANGLRVYLFNKPYAETVSIQAWVKTGSIHENEFLGSGLSHFLEHMLFQGCRNYPDQQIAHRVSELGGAINAYTSFDRTVYHIDLPAEHCHEAVNMLSSMLRYPEFPAEKFVSEKQVIERECAMGHDTPDRVIIEKLLRHTFTVHPVRHPIIGYADKIQAVTREMMMTYYQRRYSPERIFFVIVGDIDSTATAAMVEEELGDWERGNLSDVPLPDEPRQMCARQYTHHFADPLARLTIGYKIPAACHPDIPVLHIISAILGRSDSSRLVHRLVIDEELALAVNMFAEYSPYLGLCGIYAVAQPDKLPKLETAIRDELDKAISSEVTAAEVEREILHASTSYLRSLESNSGIAMKIGAAVINFDNPGYADFYLNKLTSVTPEEVQRVAAKYFHAESATTVRLVPQQPQADTTVKAQVKTPQVSSLPILNELGNGTKMVWFSAPQLPLINMTLCLPGGCFFEPSGKSGISALTANVLLTGTRRWNEKELARQLDDNGISLQVNSHINSLSIDISCRRDKIRKAVEILQTILAEPAFPEKPFIREQENLLNALRSWEIKPQIAAFNRMRRELYGSHPYANSEHGSAAAIATLSTTEIRKFFITRCLNSCRAVIGIAGDIELNDAEQLARELHNAIPWNQEQLPSPSKPQFPQAPRSAAVVIPREQTVVVHALPGTDNLSDNDVPVSLLLAAENHLASVLFKTIREDAGLAYYTGLSCMLGIHQGFFAFYAGTAPEHTALVIELLEAERRRLLTGGLTHKEFTAAKASALFELNESRQRPGKMLKRSCLELYYGKDCRTPWLLAERYAKITADEVNKVIAQLMRQPTITVTAGPDGNKT